MQINMLPYIPVDGIPTFADSELKSLYQRMEEEGSVKWFFYGGGIDSGEDFARHVKSPNIAMWVVESKEDRRPLAIILLDGVRNKTAYGHFIFFKETWGKTSVTIGKEAISELLAMDSIEMIYGLLPEENKLAIRFTEKIGGIRMNPILPKGAWNGVEKKPVPAVMFYFMEDENADS